MPPHRVTAQFDVNLENDEEGRAFMDAFKVFLDAVVPLPEPQPKLSVEPLSELAVAEQKLIIPGRNGGR